MPLILGGTAVTAASQRASCRFDSTANTYFTSDFVGDGAEGTSKQATFSMWVKQALEDNRATLISGKGSGYAKIRFADDGAGGYFALYGTGTMSSTSVYRDPNAWMHVVITYDTGQAAGADRFRVWINNEQITAWDTASYPGQDSTVWMTSADDLELGSYQAGGAENFDGYMAEYICIDNAALTPTSFGAYDSDSPTIWTPKSSDDIKLLTFGTKGYYLDFSDSADMGADVSGNGNDFTGVNITAVNQCTDHPTNNFCTMSPILGTYVGSGADFTLGNTKIAYTASGTYAPNYGTLGVNAGKWYWEVTPTARTSGNDYMIGVASTQTTATTEELGHFPNDVSFYSSSGEYRKNDAYSSGYGSSWDTDEVIGIALDLTNMNLYFAIDNVWQDSGVPTSGATGTGAIDISLSAYTTANPALGGWFPALMYYDSGGVGTFETNFGNPPSANTSDAADGNDYGKFEYAPPSGYLAICTKNLGSDGG